MTHTEAIICPNCETAQTAVVNHTPAWDNLTHFCEKCEYIIMESEWERVEVQTLFERYEVKL